MHSVGVARQYCGELGKSDNCQAAVSLSVSTWHSSLPIAWRLYLPEVWCQDAEHAKAKGFALFCGGKRLLIFNENLDCEYLKMSYLKAMVLARTREGRLLPQSWAQRIRKPVYTGYRDSMRLLFLPVRFVILLIASGSLFCSRLGKNKTRS
jgi:hypothetical protein